MHRMGGPWRDDEREKGRSADATEERLARTTSDDDALRTRLVAFARRIIGDHHEAEDVVQETLIRARERRGTLRDASRFESWLFRICRHTAIDHLRGRQVRRGVWAAMSAGSTRPETARDHTPVTLASLVGPLVEASAPRDAEAIERRIPDAFIVLRRLPAHHRLLMEAYYRRGLPQWRLCLMTGLSPSALRVRLFRARGRLARSVRVRRTVRPRAS